jgi:hypothetical protein
VSEQILNSDMPTQGLSWDEFSVQQRLTIINALCPPCFPAGARQMLACKAWADIHEETRNGLSRERWETLISGGVQ